MTGVSEAAGRRAAAPAVLVAVLVFLAVESTAVASLGTPLLPTVQRDDHVSLAASQWALTITLLAGAVATPVMGRLGDGRLRRQTTLGGVAFMLAGCTASALPGGFAVFLAGRGLQGAGLGLVPLATAVARDDLPADRSRPTIALIGVTTAAGIGIGYPLVGLLAEYFGLAAPFWFVAALSALALAAGAAVLPPSPRREARLDLTGALTLGLGITGLLLTLAEGPVWGWASPASLGCAAASVGLLAGWVVAELRASHPLINLRLLRHRSVLAANVTAFLVAVGFYPLASLVVRYAATPPGAGYGFGASVVVAGLMLTPFSLASFAASRVAGLLARRTSAELVVAASCVLLIASMVAFGFARGAYWQIVWPWRSTASAWAACTRSTRCRSPVECPPPRPEARSVSISWCAPSRTRWAARSAPRCSRVTSRVAGCSRATPATVPPQWCARRCWSPRSRPARCSRSGRAGRRRP
jgi:predicted MFS family arabinose efflux permease